MIIQKIERPQSYTHEKRDCTVRAMSKASGHSYDIVHQAWKVLGRKTGRGIRSKKHIQDVCKLLDIKAKQVKRSGSVKKFVNDNKIGKYFCLKRGHAFAICDGIIYDLDSINSHLQGAWLIEKNEQKEVLKDSR